VGKNSLINRSFYQGKTFILTTMHGKSQAVAPIFQKELGVQVVEVNLNTDLLGTFTGDIPRIGSPLKCVQKKCEWGLEKTGHPWGLSSEGSFGPHPLVPFLSQSHEILYFIDKDQGFHLYVEQKSLDINYQEKKISTLEDLFSFAQSMGFPEQGIIVRTKSLWYKDFFTRQDLEKAFQECLQTGEALWVETDMRAHRNPRRMETIREISVKMAARLLNTCPMCECPGWGIIRSNPGLPCEGCKAPTPLFREDVWGCPLCQHEISRPRSDGPRYADPGQCSFCNP